MENFKKESPHSAAWGAQVWISFLVSITMTSIGIIFLPVGMYAKGFLGMGLLFSVGSSLSLAKTVRDQHESAKVLSQLNEAKIQKILADHDPSEA